ncbi:hypothetical protein LCGC14_3046470, partial [marine sediment metagenome]
RRVGAKGAAETHGRAGRGIIPVAADLPVRRPGAPFGALFGISQKAHLSNAKKLNVFFLQAITIKIELQNIKSMESNSFAVLRYSRTSKLEKLGKAPIYLRITINQ